MDLKLIIKSLEVLTELGEMIDCANAAARNNPEACRVGDNSLKKWKETYEALSSFVSPYKAQALEWYFQEQYLNKKKGETEQC